MQFELIGNKHGSDVYFPTDITEKVVWVVGGTGTGKSSVLETLNDYNLKNGIKSVLVSPESKSFIPIEEIENILCLFKLWNNKIALSSNSYQAAINFKDYYRNLNMREYPGPLYKLLIILNVFYLVTYNDYSVILIDEFYSEYQGDFEYLFRDKDIQIISTLQVSNLSHKLMNPAKNVILVQDCFKKKTKLIP